LDDALRRAELYLRSGADGVFIEAPESRRELERVGSEFRHVPQLANMLEAGRTPLLSPAELFRMGFAMVAYPTSLIFRVTRTIEKALAELKAGRLELAGEGVDFEAFKDVVGFAPWVDVEERYDG
jgi:2-methylisocitrate lyase-like PEP mutase family enzyme